MTASAKAKIAEEYADLRAARSQRICRLTAELASAGSIDQEIEVFNAVGGYEIDYETGRFWEV